MVCRHLRSPGNNTGDSVKIITKCIAEESCPYFPGGKKMLHQSFADPSALIGTEKEIMAGFRRIRDEIKSWIENDSVNL